MAGVRREDAARGRKRKRSRNSDSSDDGSPEEDMRRRLLKLSTTKAAQIKDEENGSDDEATKDSGPVLPEYTEFRSVHSKRKVMAKKLMEKRKAKKAGQQERKDERKRLGKDAPPKMVPKTIESMREPDATFRTGDEEEDAEVLMDEAGDEMASYFRKEVEPRVLVTTSEKATAAATHFAKDLSKLIPNAKFFLRKRVSIKGTVARAKERGFTDIAVINEDRKECTGLLLIHLPDGPTAYFRLSSAKATNMMRKKWEFFGQQRPEIILNNFSTKLGHRVARMLASMFHYDPEFRGRRVVTFHNQRDYIFFRQHRYEFKSDKKVALKELGPRFTLKLRWVQKGTFDTKTGEYEWVHRRGEMDTSRRRFHL